MPIDVMARGKPKIGVVEHKTGNSLTIAFGEKRIDYKFADELKGTQPKAYNLTTPEWQSYKAPKESLEYIRNPEAQRVALDGHTYTVEMELQPEGHATVSVQSIPEAKNIYARENFVEISKEELAKLKFDINKIRGYNNIPQGLVDLIHTRIMEKKDAINAELQKKIEEQKKPIGR